MAPSVIPQDVIDSIIGELRDESATLKECCLVSRAFLSPSRRHLFATVELDDIEPSRRLLSVLSSDSTVGSYIRHLRLKDNYYFYRINRKAGPYILTKEKRTWAPTAGEILSSLFSALGCLTSLQLNSLKWADLPLVLQIALSSLLRFPSLTHVQLIAVGDLPITQFANLSQLKSLSVLRYASTESRWRALPHFPITCSKKSQLEFLEFGDSEMVQAMLDAWKTPDSSLDISQLREISIISDDVTDGPSAFQEVLMTARHSIESVIWHWPVAPPPFRLDVLSNLRSLLQQVNIGRSMGPGYDPIPWLLHTLRTSSMCNTLETLTVAVYTTDFWAEIARDAAQPFVRYICEHELWAGLNALPIRGYKNLRKVNIWIQIPLHHYQTEWDMDNQKRSIPVLLSERMPLLRDQGFLHFACR